MPQQKYLIYWAAEYNEWFNKEPPKSRFQIIDRLGKIEYEGYFGNHKHLDDEIWELKFNDGRRIYYVYLKNSNILLLLGGNKNGQDKDISKAKNIYRKRSLKKEESSENSHK